MKLRVLEHSSFLKINYHRPTSQPMMNLTDWKTNTACGFLFFPLLKKIVSISAMFQSITTFVQWEILNLIVGWTPELDTRLSELSLILKFVVQFIACLLSFDVLSKKKIKAWILLKRATKNKNYVWSNILSEGNKRKTCMNVMNMGYRAKILAQNS